MLNNQWRNKPISEESSNTIQSSVFKWWIFKSNKIKTDKSICVLCGDSLCGLITELCSWAKQILRTKICLKDTAPNTLKMK